MYQKFTNVFFSCLIILIFLSIISLDSFSNSENKIFSESVFHYNSNSLFSWPLFGYYNISSNFGYRKSPTTGASTYHSGIDIPGAPRYKYILYL